MVPTETPITYSPDQWLTFRAKVYDYTGRAGQAVRMLKYARSTSLADFMSCEIARTVVRLGLGESVVVPIPIHPSRRRHRGFNQAELLADKLSFRLDLLVRVRPTRPQALLNLEQRLANLDGAFRASTAARSQAVLLVDDVVTTGHTARECARALLDAGASEVGILAFCGED